MVEGGSKFEGRLPAWQASKIFVSLDSPTPSFQRGACALVNTQLAKGEAGR
jgi:hypothetical protein